MHVAGDDLRLYPEEIGHAVDILRVNLLVFDRVHVAKELADIDEVALGEGEGVL